jgi:SulP family sulfate permease
MKPRVAVLGRFKDGTLRDIEINKDLPTDKNIIAVRFDGSLYFANVSYFEDAMLKAVSTYPDAKYLLVVGDAINEIDASGEEVLHHLVDSLHSSGITVVFSGLKRQILQVMMATELIDVIGQQNIFANEDFALDAIYERLEVDASGEVCALKRSSVVQPIPGVQPV